jgi:hypothetical protein
MQQLRRLDPGFLPRRPRIKPRSGHVGFMVNKAALVQVSSEYFGPFLPSFHQLFHTHYHPSFGTGRIGRRVKRTHPPQERNNNNNIDTSDVRHRRHPLSAQRISRAHEQNRHVSCIALLLLLLLLLLILILLRDSPRCTRHQPAQQPISDPPRHVQSAHVSASATKGSRRTLKINSHCAMSFRKSICSEFGGSEG